MELHSLIEVEGGVQKSLGLDLDPELPPEHAQAQDDLGEREAFFPPLLAQVPPVDLDLLFRCFLGDPLAELAIDPVGSLVEFLFLNAR